MSELVWGKMDPKIVPFVEGLNARGIITFASCSGHDKINPWIHCRIRDDEYDEADIISAMVDMGCGWFSLKRVWHINRSDDPVRLGDRYHFWEIMLWRKENEL